MGMIFIFMVDLVGPIPLLFSDPYFNLVSFLYSLFSLQDNLKERELCVFFRNNHFSTMYKVCLNCQLYNCFGGKYLCNLVFPFVAAEW